ncbi:MAG: ImmA/IrrE family metallo-endopeptidase [Patescibacteria group bacterium]
MITHAEQKAQIITIRFQSNDPYFIAEKENIEVVEYELSGRLKELYFGDHIILNNKMPYTQKRHYLAHALGHHYLHTGNQLYFSQHRQGQNDKEETQAEEFSAYLLIPSAQIIPILDCPPDELADQFQVSPQFILYRLSLIKNNNELLITNDE